ncbi:hypothetical protein BEL04_09600 [Mucilaginibacter sp. PPCGB 2223]|uniref:DUF2851 family protein n=1 Tax=Mucilaginibacter sp. PPCGB 2223 TaxID=1886027 RepID=UPI000825A871|nr:DUF2851 family protein [Mucilaginibacter sp. PPCGB 2223]OCX54483.1 hypothetical protein BEL04_09600 [Mucilaginibacter sp. PPCGB 2223]
MMFNEDFLQYVWKFRLFNKAGLLTTLGETVEIVSPGLQNIDSGPDFQHAKIKIGNTLWAGNVEVHLSSSGWKQHGHTTDDAYDNVILHVVCRDDTPVYRKDGTRIPTIILNDRIPDELFAKYNWLINEPKQIIPCEASIGSIDPLLIHNWLTRVLVERLQKRSNQLAAAIQTNKGDWEETFYQYLAANFGFKVNALPFELLAKSLPQNILAKHKNNPMQIEALIFGQAGFLTADLKDEYPVTLRAEYQFLQKKYNLKPLQKHLWKFSKLRPLNFPTIRLAQFAALVYQSNHLFSKVLDIRNYDDYAKLFTDIKMNSYWDDHYQFDKPSKPAAKNLGKSSVDILLLNTIVLYLFSYGNQHQQERYVNRALHLLEFLPVEQNSIIAGFVTMGVKAGTAYESQALLELKNVYCNYKKCLQCGIGNKILKPAM